MRLKSTTKISFTLKTQREHCKKHGNSTNWLHLSFDLGFLNNVMECLDTACVDLVWPSKLQPFILPPK